MSQSSALWTKLQDHDLVVGEQPASGEIDSPWYVKTLMAVSAWIASILLFIFIALVFDDLFDSVAACLIIGGLMVAGAFIIFRQQGSDFFEHLGLAASLAGQVLIAIAVFQMTDESWFWIWTLGAVFQVVLSITMSHFLHRVFSSFFAAIAFSMALYEVGIAYLFGCVVMFIGAWIWLNEFSSPRYQKMFNAIGYGLVLAMIQIKGTGLFVPRELLWDATVTDYGIRPWMGEALSCAVLLFVVWRLLKKYHVGLTSPIALMAFSSTLLIGLVSLEANGITVGLMILVLGFSSSNRVLMGLGIVSLLSYVSAYYYFLDVTLLEKSMTLLILGLVLLLIRWTLVHCSLFKKALSDA